MAFHARDQMDDYLRGLLTPAERECFARHVALCPSCQGALEESTDARQCLEWLAPTEAPPEPGPDFYFRVQQSIEHRFSQGWFNTLAASLRPRLAYPLVFLVLLLVAWALTYETREADDGLLAMEFPAAEFAQMSFSDVSADRSVSQDLVMMNLVELPEDESRE